MQPTTQKEQEPRVLTEDVQRVLRSVIQPDADDAGESVVALASRAETSARTIYRILALNSETISLDLADRVCIAANGHLMSCRLIWPDGRVAWYLD